MVASYVVSSRQNSNLQIAGIIDDYASLALVLRYNDVSEWTMTIDRKSSNIPELIPASPLGANGNGIIVTRDFGSGPQVILSGPITHLDYKMSSQLVQLKGFDDSIWLKWRRADSVPASYPYATEVLADASLLRYHKLNEASGTTATDASGHANGTYSGTFVYSQPGLIDSLDTCVRFDGATNEVAVATAGLPTASAAFSVIVWGYLTANPAGDVYLWTHGTNAAKSGAGLLINSSGIPCARIFGGTGTNVGTTAVPLNQPFMLAMTWDGTTFTGYYNGQPIGSFTPGALTIAYGFARIGDLLGASNFWPNKGGQVSVYSAALSAARMQQLYLVGRSRCADASSDNRSGLASTTMIAYVNANAGPGTLAARQVAGLSMAADPSLGGQVTGVARGDELLTILQGLALQSGDNIGFKIQQSYLTGPNTLSFSTYAPTDRTASAVFSQDIGNLLDYSYSIDYPTMNNILMGGAGASTTRAFQEGQDSGSVGIYGRIEGFMNGAASAEYLTMVNGINAQLLQTAAQTNLVITPIDTAGLQYQRDYNLGDKITVVVEGQTVQDKVREIRINLTKGGGGSPDEVITPALGQQGLAASSDSLIAQALTNLTHNIQRANKRIAKIEQNQ